MSVIIRDLQQQDYLECWHAMRDFTQQRTPDTPDELWLVEHPAVFTQGQTGKTEHILNPKAIPIVQSDRGGQVTYHGPGQLIVYTLIDLKHRQLSIRQLVSALENSVIQLLAAYTIPAQSRCDAPGVYVDQQKICSVGLRVKQRRYAYHGIALNVAMDLTPFSQINPCGYAGMHMTQLAHFIPGISVADIKPQLVDYLCQQLRYTAVHHSKTASEVADATC
ncbi:MAG: lipoyl(octanoyl) transferase LipB [Gammaproteobacteria bacterium]